MISIISNIKYKNEQCTFDESIFYRESDRGTGFWGSPSKDVFIGYFRDNLAILFGKILDYPERSKLTLYLEKV